MTAPMHRRPITSLASGLWLVTLALAIAGGVLHVITRDVPVEFYGLRGFPSPLGVLIGGIGWLIATRRTHASTRSGGSSRCGPLPGRGTTVTGRVPAAVVPSAN